MTDSPTDPGWMGPDKTPDGKWHHVVTVVNTSGQSHVYVDGEHSATWRDHRPTEQDVWRLLAVRVGPWRHLRAIGYRLTGQMPPRPERPVSYSTEVLSNSPLAYYPLGDLDGVKISDRVLTADEIRARHKD